MLKIEYQRQRRDGVEYGFSCSDCERGKRIECVIGNEIIYDGEIQIQEILDIFVEHHKEEHLRMANPVRTPNDRVGEEF